VRDALYDGRCGLGPSPIALPFETVVGAVRGSAGASASLAPWSTRTAHRSAPADDPRQPAGPAGAGGDRIAILLGTSTAGADVTENAYRHFLADGALPRDYDLFRHHTYGAILHVVRALSGAEGPAWVTSTACTSSAKPLASAKRLIDAGMIDAAIVGGIDTLCRMTSRASAVSRRSPDLRGPSRPTQGAEHRRGRGLPAGRA
jgi:3-oxoacyl-[acyl-carrier-protein] synthase-1